MCKMARRDILGSTFISCSGFCSWTICANLSCSTSATKLSRVRVDPYVGLETPTASCASWSNPGSWAWASPRTGSVTEAGLPTGTVDKRRLRSWWREHTAGLLERTAQLRNKALLMEGEYIACFKSSSRSSESALYRCLDFLRVDLTWLARSSLLRVLVPSTSFVLS